MGKFREFLVNENMGLGYLGRKIDQFYNSPDLDAKLSGSFVSDDVTQRPGYSMELPSTDMQIPQLEKTGRITILHKTKNPIYVRLEDGTEAHFTYDEYRKIQGGNPEVGKTITLIFQRHPGDLSPQVSKIEKAIVRS